MPMLWKPVFGGLSAAALWCSGVIAAPATAEQAASIKGGLERYLGRGDTTNPGPVSVTPVAEAFRIDVAIDRVLRGLAAFGFTIEPATVSVLATPQSDGTYNVAETTFPRLTGALNGKTFSMVFNNPASSGTYDPKLPGFSRSVTSYDSVSVATLGGADGTRTREEKQGRQESTTTRTGDGVADIEFQQRVASTSQDFALDGPPAEPGGGGRRISVNVGPSVTSGLMRNARLRTLTDLWAFLVAHPDKDSIKTAQADLRALLLEALPVFDTLSHDVKVENVAVDSPLGAFAIAAVGGHLDLTGLVTEGRSSLEMKLDGLSIPAGLAPAWAAHLVPNAFELRPAFSGYDLAAAAREAVAKFDLQADEPLPPETIETIKTLVGPLDRMLLTIGASRIASDLVDIRFDGEVRMALPIPDLRLNVRATGLDKAMQEIQAKAGKDKVANQVIAGLALVKGYGKGEADGSTSWIVTKSGDAITVNGVALPFGGGK